MTNTVDGAFSIILGWSLMESLGRSSGRIDIQPAQKGWFSGGMPTASLMPKSVSFVTKRTKINC